jgi:hypothetical protein
MFAVRSWILNRACCVVIATMALVIQWPAAAEIVQFKMTGHATVSDAYHFLPGDIYDGAPFTAYVGWDTSVVVYQPE